MTKVVITGGGQLLEIYGKCLKAQKLVANRALSDCNSFCKVKTGKLAASGKCNILTGELSWETPYARHAYYLGKPDKSVNPKASLMWAHKAAAIYGLTWYNIVKGALL